MVLERDPDRWVMQPMKLISRSELHDLIWTTPAHKLAKEFGLSGRGLGKLCARHEIPCPPRGYWARVAAGQPARRRALLKPSKPGLEKIHIHPTPPPPPAVTALKGEMKRLRQESPEPAAGGAIKIEEAVERPHKSISRTAAALRKAKPDRDGGISAASDGMCGVVIHHSQCERAISILHVLATSLAIYGLTIEPTGEQMILRRGEDRISFTLSEKYHREKHRPTIDEQAEYDRLVAREKKKQGGSFFWPPKEPWPEYDRIYEGKLSLKIDCWGEGIRKSWTDGSMQSLERMIDILAEGLNLALVAERVKREEQQQRAARAADLERRRGLARKRKEREKHRIDHVRRMVALRKEADETEAWLNSTKVEPNHAASSTRMRAWVARRLVDLRDQVQTLTSTVTVDGIELFPEVDDLEDPLGDPPEETRYW